MAAKKRSAVRIYFINPNTDEVVGSMSISKIYEAFFYAKSERLKIALAKSRAVAEDVAAGMPSKDARLFTATAFGYFMVSQGMLPPFGLKAPRSKASRESVSGSFSIGRKAGPVRRTSTKKRTSKKATSKKTDSERRSWLASRLTSTKRKKASKKSDSERRSWLASRLTSTKRKKTSKPKRPTSRR